MQTMKLNFRKFLFLIFLFAEINNLFSQKINIGSQSVGAVSQSDCDKIMEEAQNLFNTGMYFDSEKLLFEIKNNCHLNKLRRQDVYELLIKNELELDKVMQADSMAYKLLRNNPHYELKTENNSEDFNRLINKFDVHPQWTMGARNSALSPSFKIKKTYSAINEIDYNQAYNPNYNVLFITEYYGWLEYQWNKHFSINLEFEFNGFSYYRQLTRGDWWTLTYSEHMNFLELPVYVKYYVPLSKNFISYAALGGGLLRMYQAVGYTQLSYRTEDIYTGVQYINTPDPKYFDVLPMRNKNSFEAIGEIAVGYKLRNLKIFLYYRYFKGLTSLTNSAHRFDNPELLNTYSYIDNSIILNKYELGATISYVLKTSIKKSK